MNYSTNHFLKSFNIYFKKCFRIFRAFLWKNSFACLRAGRLLFRCFLSSYISYTEFLPTCYFWNLLILREVRVLAKKSRSPSFWKFPTASSKKSSHLSTWRRLLERLQGLASKKVKLLKKNSKFTFFGPLAIFVSNLTFLKMSTWLF